MLLLLTVALFVLIVGVLWYVRALMRRIEAQDRAMDDLTRRVFDLERLHDARPAKTAVEPVGEFPVPAEAFSTSSVHEPAIAPLPAEDWETRVGMNWLNRLGAAVLVIGFALFLGYSLTQLGPFGKVVIGIAAGLSLLMAGVALGRLEAYRNYSYSMMGAGWAVVFFTAYAAHAVPEARVIENPFTGALALLAVTALMIAHSAHYRSEAATALGCLLGFIGLNVSPLTEASVLATLLLAASLTSLSYAFRWTRLPLLGVALTYLTFALRYDASIYGRAGLMNGQATLWAYWLTFEIYDLLTLRRTPGARSLLLLNVCGFTGASILHEWKMNASDWSVFLGLAALAYLASSALRARFAASAAEKDYEWTGTASALLMAAALIERFSGTAITTALLIEGQMVLLTGMWLGSRWIQGVGAAVLAISCFRLIAVDATAVGPSRAWTPTGTFIAVACWANRWFMGHGWYFSFAGAAVAMTVVNAEASGLWVAAVWAAGAALAIGLGKAELPWLGAAVLVIAASRAAILNSDQDVLTTGIVVLAAYTGQLSWKHTQRWVRVVLSAMGTALLTLLISERVQGRLLTVWFGAEGAALLSAGFALNERLFRLSGLALFLVCIGKLFLHDLRELDTLSRILSFLVLGVVMMAASWVYTRYREKLRRLL